MSIPIGDLLFGQDGQWSSLRDALKSTCKVVRVLEDAAVYPGGLPAWQQAVLGTFAPLSSVAFSGGSGWGMYKITSGSSAGSRAILRGTASSRTFSDGSLTSGSYQITSAFGANFQPSDVGRSITSADIPANTVIVGYVNSTTVNMSQASSATATSQSVTIGALGNPVQTITPQNFKALAWTIDGLVFDADSGFDFFHGFYGQSGNPVHGGAYFRCTNGKIGGWAEWSDNSGNVVELPRVITDAYINDGTNSTSASVLVSATANFTSTDVGWPVANYTQNQNPPVPLVAGCTIESINSSTSANLSIPATASVSAGTLAIGQQPYWRPFSGSGGGRWRKNFTTLWLPQAGYLYCLRDDQVVSEMDLNPYYGTGTGQLDISQAVAPQTQLTSQDGSAHFFSWARTELILATD